MAIYGIGAYYDHDVSQDFIARGLAGVGWPYREAPELHRFVESLKVGDIIYIKAAPLANSDIVVRAVGFVKDGVLLNGKSSRGLVQAGRNVLWRVRRSSAFPSRESATTYEVTRSTRSITQTFRRRPWNDFIPSVVNRQ